MKNECFITIFQNTHLSRKSDFIIFVVLSVRNRTQNVRIRTKSRTPENHYLTYYQNINSLARFL